MSDEQFPERMDLREMAVNLLATGYSAAEVGQMIGIAPDTIRRWRRRDPSFEQAVKSLVEQIEQQRQRGVSSQRQAQVQPGRRTKL